MVSCLYRAPLAAFHTGMRRSELLGLQWCDIRRREIVTRRALVANRLKVPKSGKARGSDFAQKRPRPNRPRALMFIGARDQIRTGDPHVGNGEEGSEVAGTYALGAASSGIDRHPPAHRTSLTERNVTRFSAEKSPIPFTEKSSQP